MTAVNPVPKPEPKKRKTRSTAWRQHEQRCAKKLIAADEPDPALHKPRTGDIKDGGGDTESLRWEQECKHTEKSQYVLKVDTIIKLIKDSKTKGKKPLFNLQFTKLPWQLCFVLWDDVKEIITLRRDYEHQQTRLAELEAENAELRLLNGDSDRELLDKFKKIKKITGFIAGNIKELEREVQ